MWRVFMWTAGTNGERIWATSDTPLAQKRGSSFGARDFAAEFRREFTRNGRDIDANFFEHASAHHRHRAAATARTLPLRAHEAAGMQGVGAGAGIFVLDRLKGRADPVTQRLEPGSRKLLVLGYNERFWEVFCHWDRCLAALRSLRDGGPRRVRVSTTDSMRRFRSLLPKPMRLIMRRWRFLERI